MTIHHNAISQCGLQTIPKMISHLAVIALLEMARRDFGRLTQPDGHEGILGSGAAIRFLMSPVDERIDP